MAPIGVAPPSLGGATPIGAIGAIGAPQGPPQQDLHADVFVDAVPGPARPGPDRTGPDRTGSGALAGPGRGAVPGPGPAQSRRPCNHQPEPCIRTESTCKCLDSWPYCPHRWPGPRAARWRQPREVWTPSCINAKTNPLKATGRVILGRRFKPTGLSQNGMAIPDQ